MVGVVVLVATIWAYSEKSTIDNVREVTGVQWLDPLLFLIIIGCIIFVVSFIGCIGALREQQTMLYVVSLNFPSIKDIIPTCKFAVSVYINCILYTVFKFACTCIVLAARYIFKTTQCVNVLFIGRH